MSQKRYLRFNFLSIFFVFMLFAWGGLVRATGSGMGCPDWPKCFGSYIPPTDTAQLPADYEEQFTAERIKKTERFVALLERLGFENQAEQVRNFKDLDQSHEFNVAKAYTEYANRIWGAITGIIVLITLLFSFSFIGKNNLVFVWTLLGFLGVVVNALIGAVVVNANLLGNIVSIHFLAAFIALLFFMLARYRITDNPVSVSSGMGLKITSGILLLLIISQAVVGSGVRELFDSAGIAEIEDLDLRVEILGTKFLYHRFLAGLLFVLFGIQFLLFYRRDKWTSKASKYAFTILLLSLVQIAFGSMLLTGYAEAFSKLFHISLGATFFLVQVYICSLVFRKPKTE